MQIPTLSASDLSYEEASRQFYAPNLPFIVDGLTDEWLARRKWIKRGKRSSREGDHDFEEEGDGDRVGDKRDASASVGDETLKERHVARVGNASLQNGQSACCTGKPDWDYLVRHYGYSNVTVHGSYSPSNQDYTSRQGEEQASQSSSRPLQNEESYGEAETSERTFAGVVSLWREGKGKGLYIKDWHLAREMRDRSSRKAHEATRDSKNVGKKQTDLEVADRFGEMALCDAEEEDVPQVNKCHCQVSTSSITDHHDSTPSEPARFAPSQGRMPAHKQERKKGEEEDNATFFNVPEIFQDDWMDSYYTSHTDDDFTFVYFGTSGTFTPLHRDVYTSYSWSANILGRKMWYFVPPSSVPFIRQYPSNPRSAVLPDIRPGKVDLSKYPHFAQAEVISVLQEEGSIIFVPSGWYHCVENLGTDRDCQLCSPERDADESRADTASREKDSLDFVISINRNWGNGWNLRSMWESMKEEVEATEAALSDVRQVLERGQKERKARDRRKAAGRASAMISGNVEYQDTSVWGESVPNETPDDDDIEKEWYEIVQGVLEQNVGWGWNTFFAMIRHNLLHPPAPPSLSPPPTYLCGTLCAIFDLVPEGGEEDAEQTQDDHVTGCSSVLMHSTPPNKVATNQRFAPCRNGPSSMIRPGSYDGALEAALQFIRTAKAGCTLEI